MIFLDKSRIQLFDHTSIKCKAFFRDLALLIRNLPNKKLKLWFAGSDAIDIYQHTEKLASILKDTPSENLQWHYLPQPEEQHRTIFRATKEAAFNWGLWKK